MTRGSFRPDASSGERNFRWRGGSVSRLEGLSDAIFALALTLLVVRLEVPATFAEVRFAFVSAPVYLACFALFLWIWYCHYQFHRRYGLEDPLTIAIDGAILFGVLLFALPLRFVSEMIWTSLRMGEPYVLDTAGRRTMEADGTPAHSLTWQESSTLMLFYAGGFALLFALFALQTANAYRRRDELELDEVERYVTRATVAAHLFSAGVGLVAVGLAACGGSAARWSGFAFFALGPGHGILGTLRARRVERLASRSEPGT